MTSHPDPEVGQDVYVPSELFLTHGRDDFHGGVCRIVAVKHDRQLFVEVEEHPGCWYAWGWLMEQQDDLRSRYGAERGYPDPDWRPEFNEE
jgi:hypothetical protein